MLLWCITQKSSLPENKWFYSIVLECTNNLVWFLVWLYLLTLYIIYIYKPSMRNSLVLLWRMIISMNLSQILFFFSFRTDGLKTPSRYNSPPTNGRGFKFIITAFSEGELLQLLFFIGTLIATVTSSILCDNSWVVNISWRYMYNHVLGVLYSWCISSTSV